MQTQLISKSIWNFHLLCQALVHLCLSSLLRSLLHHPMTPPDMMTQSAGSTRQKTPNPLSLQPPAPFHPVRLYFTPLPVLSRYLSYLHCQSQLACQWIWPRSDLEPPSVVSVLSGALCKMCAVIVHLEFWAFSEWSSSLWLWQRKSLTSNKSTYTLS